MVVAVEGGGDDDGGVINRCVFRISRVCMRACEHTCVASAGEFWVMVMVMVAVEKRGWMVEVVSIAACFESVVWSVCVVLGETSEKSDRSKCVVMWCCYFLSCAILQELSTPSPIL